MTIKQEANVRKDAMPVLTLPTNTSEELKELLQNVDLNPAKVVWPRDTWGFTSPVKRELLKAISSIRGDAQKQTLMESVLIIALKHMKARAAADLKERELRSERAKVAEAERFALQRVYSDPQPI